MSSRPRRTKLTGALAGVAVAATIAHAMPARADTVTDWNVHATAALIATAGHSQPGRQGRRPGRLAGDEHHRPPRSRGRAAMQCVWPLE